MTSDSPEQLKTIVTEHWVKYLAPFLAWGVLVMIAVWIFLLAGTAASHAENVMNVSFLFACAITLVAHHLLFYYLLSDALGEVLITSKRVISFQAMLFLNNDILEIPLNKIRIVRAERHGLMQNLFNYGSLHFDGHGTLKRIPHPHRMSREIAQMLEMK